jgi:hypothetical protein
MPIMRNFLALSAGLLVSAALPQTVAAQGSAGAPPAVQAEQAGPGSSDDLVVKGMRSDGKTPQGSTLVQYMTHSRGLTPSFGLLNCTPATEVGPGNLQCELPVTLTQTDPTHPQLGYGELHVALFDGPRRNRASKPIVHDWTNWDAKDGEPVVTAIRFSTPYRPTAVKGWVSQWIGHPPRPLREPLLASKE